MSCPWPKPKLSDKFVPPGSPALERSLFLWRDDADGGKTLWLVTGVLIIDHVMNGELMWSYPFFTAATSPEGVSEMVREMSTVGVAMSAFITSVWAVMIIARKYKAQSLAKAEVHTNH